MVVYIFRLLIIVIMESAIVTGQAGRLGTVLFSSRSAGWVELSNFFMFLSKVMYILPFGGMSDKFQSNEHFYVYVKICFFLTGTPKRLAINALWGKKSGWDAKKHGRNVIPDGVLDYFKHQWGCQKKLLMKIGLLNKCLVCPEFRESLKLTNGKDLHEDTLGTNFWNMRGSDVLGQLMMEVRDVFLKDSVKQTLSECLIQFERLVVTSKVRRKNREKLLSRLYHYYSV
jgi:predicted NAD-dependent protein-ADP-ribosyltransferase YbiA (DUF1768 family)